MWIELSEDIVESMSFYGAAFSRIEIQVASQAAMERKRKGEPLWVVTDQEKLNLLETEWLREKVAFAEGRLIQSRYISLSDGGDYKWERCPNPKWTVGYEYRIKPEPKQDVVRKMQVDSNGYIVSEQCVPNIKLVFDGETGELKDAVKL